LKGKFLVLLLLLGVLPLLAVGGFALHSLSKASQGGGAPVAATAANAPDMNAAQSRVQDASGAMLRAIQSALSDGAGLLAKPTEAEFQSFLAAHPGFTAVYRLGADGKPVALVPTGSTVVDASYSSTEEFQSIQKRAADASSNWPYLYYSRRGSPVFVFVNKLATGGFVGSVLDLGYFFKDPGFAKGEAFLVDAGTGQILFGTNPNKTGTAFSSPGDTWRESILQGIKNKTPGQNSTAKDTAVFASLGIGLFGLVQTLPMEGAVAAQKNAPAAGLTSENLMQNPLVWMMLAALVWVLVVGIFLRSAFLKPIGTAQKLLEAAVSGQSKVSEEALAKIGSSEVQALVRASTKWADRLEREKEDISRRREEDAHRAGGQLQKIGQELSEAVQKVGELKTSNEQKDQQVASKQQELEALKGMGEGLRNQAEQARGEVAKLKAQMSNAELEGKRRETDLRHQMDQQTVQATEQLKDLESKMLQVVAAANPITVSRVRVAAIKTMSEELKTTLGIIKGYVSSALGSAQSGITEKQQEFLGMVINRSARLEKFINDLVDIFQVEIDQETAPREEVALTSEIEGMAFNFQPQADIKNIKIRVEEKGGPIPKVPIVRRRFTQLWNILYLQIIKDSPRGSLVPVTVERMGEDVKVTILDPGLNVKPELLPNLFDEFYDPKHPASPQLAGTGLKFALVKTILAAHGGGALAEKAETGTRLTLTFPLKIKKKENPAAALFASVKLPSSSAPAAGGLLGAVKPGTVASKPTVHPATTFGFKPAAPSALPATGQASGLKALLSGKGPQIGAILPPSAPKSSAFVPPGLPPNIHKSEVPPLPAATSAGAPWAPPVTPKPVIPPALAKPSPVVEEKPSEGLEKLFNIKPEEKPAMPKPPAIAPGLEPPTLKPPTAPPVPGIPRPLAPNIPGAPPLAAGAKIVPTTIRPTAPPPGILDLENQDGMKTEAGPSVPKVAAPPPSAPPSGAVGKPIIKDLDKENGDDTGELIE